MNSSVCRAKPFSSEPATPSRVRNPSAIRSVRSISLVRVSIDASAIAGKRRADVCPIIANILPTLQTDR